MSSYLFIKWKCKNIIWSYCRKPAQPGDYTGYYQSLAGLQSTLKNELNRLIVNTGFATGTTNQVKVDKWNGSCPFNYTGMDHGNREHAGSSRLGSVRWLHNLRAANVDVNGDRNSIHLKIINHIQVAIHISTWQWLVSGRWHIDVANCFIYINYRYSYHLVVW